MTEAREPDSSLDGEIDAPVVIVGGGPVGTALAIDLAQRGVRSVVIERYQDPQPVPKGQNLTQRTVEHFRRWGVEADLRAAAPISTGKAPTGLVVHGQLTGEHYYPWLQRDLVSSFYAARNARLPQYSTERVLRSRLRSLPQVDARYGWTAESVVEKSDGVEVEIVSRSGERDTVRAYWAVGCDGGRSRVRQAAGIEHTGVDHDRLMVLLVFRSREFDQILQDRPDPSFISVLHPDLEGYWQFFGRVDATETWFFHAPVDPNSDADSIDLDEVLFRAVGQHFSYDVEYLGFWDLRFALADNYLSGRMLVAGDAAHSHPPYGGYGINSGFEDAVNLGWKLAAIVQGWAGPELLASYDEERRHVFASTRDDFIDRSIRVDKEFLNTYSPVKDMAAFEQAWSARQHDAQDEVRRFEPNYEGSPLLLGPASKKPSAVGTHAREARVGHHLAPGTTPDGDSVFDQLGQGFTVLAGDGADACGFERVAAQLGVPLKALQLSAASVEAYGADLVLVRPDQFVAWVGEADEQTAASVLSRSIGHASLSHETGSEELSVGLTVS